MHPKFENLSNDPTAQNYEAMVASQYSLRLRQSTSTTPHQPQQPQPTPAVVAPSIDFMRVCPYALQGHPYRHGFCCKYRDYKICAKIINTTTLDFRNAVRWLTVRQGHGDTCVVPIERHTLPICVLVASAVSISLCSARRENRDFKNREGPRRSPIRNACPHPRLKSPMLALSGSQSLAYTES